MIRAAKKGLRLCLRRIGYDVVPAWSALSAAVASDFSPDPNALIDYCFQCVQPFTMTSKERIIALRQSVEYVARHEVPGDIVECGVWKGGSMMAVARTLLEIGARRKLYLFDTFDGMSCPTGVDKDFQGDAAAELMAAEEKKEGSIWAYSPIEEVKRNLRTTGYDEGQIVFVKGKVEDTLPANAPERISLLRLDTDWYESTYHELVHLYPRLSVGGVLIIDDYGHWEGARKAVDRYISERNLKLLLCRIDYTGRLAVKLEA